jgi:hypothetical protein
MFNGHTHPDLLLWIGTTAGPSLGPRDSSTGAPVVTLTGNKLGFRVYQIGRSGAVNYQQYSADKFPQSGDEFAWKLEYDFRETHDTSDDSPESLKKVVDFVQEANDNESSCLSVDDPFETSQV